MLGIRVPIGTGIMYLQELYYPFGTEVHVENWRQGWGRVGGLERVACRDKK
jgi:hypothetical protein